MTNPTSRLAGEAMLATLLAFDGWITYFRIYGPLAPAFDGTWKPGDFEEVK